jgi:hypothetical protein
MYQEHASRFDGTGTSNLTPFDTSWMQGSGAAPLRTQNLFYMDELSIPTALLA